MLDTEKTINLNIKLNIAEQFTLIKWSNVQEELTFRFALENNDFLAFESLLLMLDNIHSANVRYW